MKTVNGLEPNIWKEEYRIRSYEVDARGDLSILSIFNFMQDAASNHADALGVSVQRLQDEGRTWVLSRLKLVMDSYPGWRERVWLHTWPSGAQKLFALRDFRLHDQALRPIGSAVSAWLVIDMNSRRPVRIGPYIEKLRPVLPDPGTSDALDKLPGMKASRFETRFRVRYRDMDVNQHVNNVSYVEWAVESIPPAAKKGRVLSSLEINFLSEAFPGDAVIAYCQPENDDHTIFLHGIRREETGKELVRVKTTWVRGAQGA